MSVCLLHPRIRGESIGRKEGCFEDACECEGRCSRAGAGAACGGALPEDCRADGGH